MPKNIERDDVKRQDRKDARIRYKYMIQLSDKFNLRKERNIIIKNLYLCFLPEADGISICERYLAIVLRDTFIPISAKCSSIA